MSISRPPVALAALLLVAGTPAAGDVVLPSLLSDGVVLQRQTDAAVWGWAGPREAIEVTASWSRTPVATFADDRGSWIVEVRTPEAGGPHTLTVKGDTTVTVRDVMIGEVWLGSGQSNMEMPLGDFGGGYTGVVNSEAEIAAAQDPDLRLFTVENRASAMPRIDCRGAWRACTPESARGFSATAYFFGRELRRTLGVPVGLISADWGGTPARSWTSAEALGAFPRYEAALAHLRDMADPDARAVVVRERVEISDDMPSTLFNGMIAPLTNHAIGGVIWYQGESDRQRADHYRELFPALIRDWRRRWDRGDLPFGFVQIAPFGYRNDAGETAALRDAQASALALPNTGMVVTLDIGDPRDIHPKNKQEVGRRLARWALARIYGHAQIPDAAGSARLAGMRRAASGASLIVELAPAGGALALRPTAANPFEIAGTDGRFGPAEAEVREGRLLLWSPDVADPVAVRYAWSAAPEAALFDDGLPVAPFRLER